MLGIPRPADQPRALELDVPRPADQAATVLTRDLRLTRSRPIPRRNSAAVFRAFGAQDRALALADSRVDDANRALFYLWQTNQWLRVSMNLVGQRAHASVAPSSTLPSLFVSLPRALPFLPLFLAPPYTAYWWEASSPRRWDRS